MKKPRTVGVLLAASVLLAVTRVLFIGSASENNISKETSGPAVTKRDDSIDTQSDLVFQEYAQALLTEIPTRDDLKNEPEENLHHTPKVVQAFSQRLAHIQESMRSDPHNIEAGVRFYERCALDPKALVSVRAVCLKLFRTWDKKQDIPVPDEVARILEFFPGDEL